MPGILFWSLLKIFYTSSFFHSQSGKTPCCQLFPSWTLDPFFGICQLERLIPLIEVSLALSKLPAGCWASQELQATNVTNVTNVAFTNMFWQKRSPHHELGKSWKTCDCSNYSLKNTCCELGSFLQGKATVVLDCCHSALPGVGDQMFREWVHRVGFQWLQIPSLTFFKLLSFCWCLCLVFLGGFRVHSWFDWFCSSHVLQRWQEPNHSRPSSSGLGAKATKRRLIASVHTTWDSVSMNVIQVDWFRWRTKISKSQMISDGPRRLRVTVRLRCSQWPLLVWKRSGRNGLMRIDWWSDKGLLLFLLSYASLALSS